MIHYPNLSGSIAAFTGHRPDKLGLYNPDIASRLNALAHEVLERTTPAAIVSGMALGWDQAVAVTAIRHGIPVIAVVPTTLQESRWPTNVKLRYLDLLKRCHEVVKVHPGVRGSRRMQVFNHWKVNHSDFLIALWNGTPGVTENCMRYAEAVRKPSFNVWSDWCNQTL